MSEGNLNILMATNGMDIGGAETHIVELCRELKSRGHMITVASGGGVYVADLEKAGVQHVTVPLGQRQIGAMGKSYLTLRRLLKQQKFDIIHAHARIPSLLCSLLRFFRPAKRKIPFVTTAHLDFHTKGLAKHLSRWGERTLAVSADIRSYLVENYKLDAQTIALTINGIDMGQFSPGIAAAPIRAEFAVPESAPLLLHVSRLDDGPADVAEQLIAIAPRLAEALPDVQILIVGGGSRYGELSARAEKVNHAAGRKLLHLAGARRDIADCIAACDAFVGVSRAALEAMSMEKPVILAGFQGYAGLFTEKKLAVSRHTNFCFRGEALPTEERLLQDCIACLSLSPAEREIHGAYGREVISRHYSVAAMADDALAVYDQVLHPPKRLLISGYYGFDNMGDEAILHAFLQSTKKLSTPVHVTVLSKNPKQTTQKYGCRAVNRFHILALWHTLQRCHVLISGGGSLLQDKSSTRSIVYYLAIIRLAKLLGKPVMLYANGVGPVSRAINRRRVRRIAGRADVITLREHSSRDELIRMGVTAPALHVTADPIFHLEAVSSEVAHRLLQDAGIPTDKPLIGISVRHLRTSAGFLDKMASFADRITAELGAHVVFITMQRPHDELLSRDISARMKNTASILGGGNLSPEAFIGVCGQLQLVVTMRLHTMLFAVATCTPAIGLICDPKIEYFLEELGLPSAGAVEALNSDTLFAQTQKLMAELENHREILSRKLPPIQARAAENGGHLENLLQGLDQ